MGGKLDLKVAGGSEDSRQNESKSNIQLLRTVRLVSEKPSGSHTQEIGKDILFGRERTKYRTVRRVNVSSFSQSCVPVSVD